MVKKEQEISVAIEIPSLEIKDIIVTLNGTTPLICHRWSEKAKKMMLDKAMHKASVGREAKRPELEYASSLYWMDGIPKDLEKMSNEDILDEIDKGRFGFPTSAFKASAIAGGYRAKVLPNKVTFQGAFHIYGELTEIIGRPEPFESSVRIGRSGAEMRYRAMFRDWSVKLPIRYNSNVISAEQIISIFRIGGFVCGVGDWRPEKNGSHGMYDVPTQIVTAVKSSKTL